MNKLQEKDIWNNIFRMLEEAEDIINTQDDKAQSEENTFLDGFICGENSLITSISDICKAQHKTIEQQFDGHKISESEKDAKLKLIDDILHSIVNDIQKTHHQISNVIEKSF